MRTAREAALRPSRFQALPANADIMHEGVGQIEVKSVKAKAKAKATREEYTGCGRGSRKPQEAKGGSGRRSTQTYQRHTGSSSKKGTAGYPQRPRLEAKTISVSISIPATGSAFRQQDQHFGSRISIPATSTATAFPAASRRDEMDSQQARSQKQRGGKRTGRHNRSRKAHQLTVAQEVTHCLNNDTSPFPRCVPTGSCSHASDIGQDHTR